MFSERPCDEERTAVEWARSDGESRFKIETRTGKAGNDRRGLVSGDGVELLRGHGGRRFS